MTASFFFFFHTGNSGTTCPVFNDILYSPSFFVDFADSIKKYKLNTV